MPKEHLMIELSYGSKDKRIIKITAVGIRYKELLREMRAGSLIRKRELK